MAQRYRAESLKPIKDLIGAGKYAEAETVLLARRDSLLKALEHPDCDEAKVELILTCVNSLLVECTSLSGKPAEAESWFVHALRHCSESHDPMVRVRLHRIHAMHLYRTGHLSNGLTEIDDVIRELNSAAFELGSQMPLERKDVELAYSTSCKAEIVLAQYPGLEHGADLAHAVRPILRGGSKPRYELQNLMVCLSATNRLRQPLLHRRMMMRAWYLNERHVRNNDIRVRLIDIESKLPLASTVRSALGGVVR